MKLNAENWLEYQAAISFGLELFSSVYQQGLGVTELATSRFGNQRL